MITLTKEWLLKTIAELEEERDAVPGVVNEDAAKALAAMKLALASLMADPVTTAYKLPFEQWLSQQTGTIDVECGCVMTEVFFHWLRVAYEAGNSPATPEVGWLAVSECLTSAQRYSISARMMA